MKASKRSACPISYSLELLGDRWTCLVLRDLVFYDRRYFQDFLQAPEGVASNVLAERLARLEARGIVRKEPDAADGRRHVYSLTDAGLDLIPLLVELTLWGGTHDPESTYPRERLARFQNDREGMIRHFREQASRRVPAPSSAAPTPS